MTDVASVERWQPTQNEWHRCAPVPYPRLGARYVTLGSGTVIVSGGLDTTTSIESFLWTPTSDTWRTSGDLNSSRYLHGMCVLHDGSVLVVGGLHCSEDGTQLASIASAERWCPQSETWTNVSALPSATAEPTMIPMRDGGALLIEGYDDDFQRGCWLYDAVANTWSETGQLAIGRAGITATSLPDGSVLVVGGCNSFERGASASEVEDAELWTPATGQWTTIAGPSTARRGHTATALPDGRVVIAGGWHGDTPIRTVEVWSPN